MQTLVFDYTYCSEPECWEWNIPFEYESKEKFIFDVLENPMILNKIGIDVYKHQIDDKTIKENKQVISTKSLSKEIEVYECSDGKIFTNEQDSKYVTGKKEAELYQNKLDLLNLAKVELNFISIIDSKSEGYEKEFCFYYHEGLSNDIKLQLTYLVYDLSDLSKLRNGWYYVEQYVYEGYSTNMNCSYNSDTEIIFIEDYIEELENKLDFFKNIQSKTIK